jgi:hypothetical protein
MSATHLGGFLEPVGEAAVSAGLSLSMGHGGNAHSCPPSSMLALLSRRSINEGAKVDISSARSLSSWDWDMAASLCLFSWSMDLLSSCSAGLGIGVAE